MLKKAFWIVLLWVTVHTGRAQDARIFQPATFFDTDISRFKFPSTRLEKSDSLGCLRQFEKVVTNLRQKGFLAASVDSIRLASDSLVASVHLGERMDETRIDLSGVPEELLKRHKTSGLQDKQPMSAKKLNYIFEDILTVCEENGYPFASIRLDSITLQDGIFGAKLVLETGRYVTIDSIVMNGAEPVAPVFIRNYLGILPGTPYRESDLAAIPIRLRELPFVKEVRPAAVLFADKYTRLDLYLERKKASQFDGVIGLLPDATGTGKPKLTGEVHLRLQNPFRRGEMIDFDWRQLPPRSQELNIHARYPFLFNTPLGVDGSLGLYRRDTLFVDVIKNIGVLVSLKGADYVKGFLKNKQSDLQSTTGLDNLNSLPPYADITTNDFGVNAHLEQLDYRLNPRKGYQLDITGAIGSRVIRKNSAINPQLYDSLQLKSTQYAADIHFRLYHPLSGRHILAIMNRSALIKNPQIFDNEMYRIGGLKSLRGFDEESIFATSYSILNIEYRYITDLNSFLFGFVNGALYSKAGLTGKSEGRPIGFGAGMNFETRLGIMSISYALGKDQGQSIQIRSGKVHFGIVNYF